MTISGKKISNLDSASIIALQNLLGAYPVSQNYTAPAIGAVDGTGAYDAENDTSSDIYALYDALLTSHPTYVSKQLLGYDHSGTLAIYAYKFTPEFVNGINGDSSGDDDINSEYPAKIIIGSGIHGNGSGGDNLNSIYAVYFFMKDLCERHEAYGVLSNLRYNVQFIILPCQNPWGINNKSRYNSRNVDLNRNFSEGWEASTDIYKGASAFSESESQIIRDVLIDNKDALCYLDCHTRGGSTYSTNVVYAVGVLNSAFRRVLQNTIAFVSNKNGVGYGLTILDTQPNSATYSERAQSIASGVIECAFKASTEDIKHSATVMKINTEYIGNLITKTIEWFKYKPKI